MTRKKEINELGPRAIKKNKNPFLNPDGGFGLIEKFPGIDYMPYESKKKGKKKR